MKPLKSIPQFKSEKQERAFWETHDSFEYLNWANAEKVHLPNLHLTTSVKISGAK